MAKTMTGARVDDDWIARLDRIAGELGKRAAGIEVNRTEATRAAIERGVVALEAELDIAPPKESKPAGKPAKKTTPKK